MPFDGDLQPHDSGWTIKVEPSPSITEQSRLWSHAQRHAYHDIAAGVAFHAVTAIQNNTLRTRRERLPLPQGVARYFFRQLRNEHNTICITIFEIHFFDSDHDHDPDGGAPAPRPLEPLVLNVSSIGDDSYTIDYVEGVLPPPPCTNEIARYTQAMSRFAQRNICPSVDNGVSGHSTMMFTSKNYLISFNDSLLFAPDEGSAAKPYPGKTRETFQFDAVCFIGRVPHRIVARLGEMERLAIGRDIDVGGANILIDNIDAQNLLSFISLHNSLAPCMQQIYPSGSS